MGMYGPAREQMEYRQGKRGGFAGTGLGCGEQVASIQDLRNGLGLDWRGAVVTSIADGGKQGGCQSGLAKSKRISFI
jgi:hypothetical protein